jgi:hypothetical protein
MRDLLLAKGEEKASTPAISGKAKKNLRFADPGLAPACSLRFDRPRSL